ncbi:MAG: 6-phosphogluconolactonase [Phycisphaeraceae bacterium]|nr:6-phosphogluconolactonase [Phycisphaeraceae bacterium]|tara:strand:- start:4237 stop:5334 length:1098 start_codon:yes stop_codon:yes gene_type:complete
MTTEDKKSFYLYVTSHDATMSESIQVFRWNGDTGDIDPVLGHTDSLLQPLYIETDCKHQFLFATDFMNACNDQSGGGICSFAIDRTTGKLSFINRQPAGDDAPCYLSVTENGDLLLLANYLSGTIKVYPISPDGHIGTMATTYQQEGASVNAARQEGPHPHSIVLSPDNRHAFSPDLGADRVYLYQVDASCKGLIPNNPPYIKVAPGGGPRHLRFDAHAHRAYLVNELSNTIVTYAYDIDSGYITELQTVSTLPPDFQKDNLSAELLIHPNGRFLYTSNRGHDSIAVFAIEQATGHLAPIGHTSTQGDFPRAFILDPSGRFLIAANEYTDSIVIFHIDGESGMLQPTGQQLNVPRPASLKWVPIA